MATKFQRPKRIRLRSARQGFISASLLAMLLVTLMVSLSLGSALAVAVERTRHTLEAIQGGLAFEQTLIEVDLGMPVVPYRVGSFRVNIENTTTPDGSQLVHITLNDRTTVKEEVWLNSAGSY